MTELKADKERCGDRVATEMRIKVADWLRRREYRYIEVDKVKVRAKGTETASRNGDESQWLEGQWGYGNEVVVL
jgi:hypothetical protein